MIEAVKSLVGHASRFDLSGLREVPNVDLPHLRQFFESVLILNRRRPIRTDERLSFKTPDDWLDEPGIRRKYEDMVFDRAVPGGKTAEKVLGVGHKIFDKALRTAAEYPVSLAWSKDIKNPLVVFQVYDRITDQSGRMRQAVIGVECDIAGGVAGWRTIRDWQVLELLNGITPREKVQDDPAVHADTLRNLLEQAGERVSADIESFRLPFKIPEWKPISVFWAAK